MSRLDKFRQLYRRLPMPIRRRMAPLAGMVLRVLVPRFEYEDIRASRHVSNESIHFGAGFDIIVVCSSYPNERIRLAGGEFVRARCRAYVEAGYRILVVEVSRRNAQIKDDLVDGVRCLRLSPTFFTSIVPRLLESSCVIAVHAVTPAIADSLLNNSDLSTCVFFFHGAEMRDYRRLFFNYSTEEREFHRLSRDTTNEQRNRVATELFSNGKCGLVFVSEYLRRVANEDMARVPSDVQVVPNFIDCDFYNYHPKEVALRKKILLVRSFSTANYGTDIAVKAIKHLAERRADLEFSVCGFGELFDDQTFELLFLPNVTVRKGVLNRQEIRRLHSMHGIFLAPSRHDTQGVTMCEAMASGLVPVTHAVGGIPEFVSDSSGELAQTEGADEYASLIEKLADDPELFIEKSKLAAKRVREKCGYSATIEKEISIFRNHGVKDASTCGTDLISINGAGEAYCRLSARPIRINVGRNVAPHLASNRLDKFRALYRRLPTPIRHGMRPLAVTVLWLILPRDNIRGSRPEFARIRHDSVDEAIKITPGSQCKFSYTDYEESKPWLDIVRSVSTQYSGRAITFIDINDSNLSLALKLKKILQIPYFIVVGDKGFRMTVPLYAALGSCAGVVCTSSSATRRLREVYVGPLNIVERGASVGDLVAIVERRESIESCKIVAPRIANKAVTNNVLIVAYFAGACSTVGVRRVNYWFEEMERLSDGRIRPYIASAIAPESPSPNYFFVPDFNGVELLEGAGCAEPWKSRAVANERRISSSINTLSYYWRFALERYFQNRDIAFDTVILSGNPYCCFDFSAFAKSNWGSRIVLDYRDPLAQNPAINYRPSAREAAANLEAGYNYQADLLLTVNSDCVDLMVRDRDTRVEVIQNGFDERALPATQRTEREPQRNTFVHAGAFNSYRRPETFVEAINPVRDRFEHIGRVPELSDGVAAEKKLVFHGLKPYEETLNLIAAADCGVVFTSDEKFESTTKIFDYLSFDLDIVVVAPNDRAEGPIANLGIPEGKIYWVKNEIGAIRNFLDKYQPSPKRPDRASKYSRAESTKTLTKLLEEL